MTWYKIQDISERTGLTLAYIRKTLKVLSETLEPHTSKGDNNSVLINDSGFVIFDRIKQQKEDGLNLPAIKERIETGVQSSMQTTVNSETSELYKNLINAHELRHQAELIAVQNRLDYLIKTLPPPDKMKDIIFLVAKLEEMTSPHLFKGKQVREAWSRLKDILGMIPDKQE